MPLNQFVPKFGRLRVPCTEDCSLFVKQLSSFVRKNFITKGDSEYESIDSVGSQLRYHALTPYHIVDQFDFDAVFNGPLNDKRHVRISDALDSFRWKRSHYWRNEGMEMQLSLNCGTRNRDWDVWFRMNGIDKEKTDRDFWERCWETAVKSLGFSNLVQTIDANGISMPDFRPETIRHERENASLDSRGFRVMTGYNQERQDCYLMRSCPNGTSDAAETLDAVLSSLIQLWGRDPDVDTKVTRTEHGPHVQEAFWEVQKELVIWDRIYTRRYVGDMRKLIPIDFKPQGDEIVVAQCFSVNPVLHSDIFWVPLEVCRVHTSTDLWIEFQVHDATWFQKFADATGLPIEQWVGDHVSRWGWYARIRPGDHSITITPSPGSKPIEVPPSEPAIKKASAAKSTNKKSAKNPPRNRSQDRKRSNSMPFVIEQEGKRILNDGSLYIEPGSPIPDLNETGHLAAWNEMLDQVDAGEVDLICITVTDDASVTELEAYLRSELNPDFSRFERAISTSKLKIDGMPERRQRKWTVD